MTAPIRRSPLTGSHRELRARFELEAGWEIVAGYPDERPLATASVAVAEITPRAKVDVRASTVESATNAPTGLAAVVASDWALVLGAPGAEDALIATLQGTAGGDAMVTDATHLYAGFALVGSRLDELMARLTAFDASSLPVGSAAGAPLLDVPAILVRRDTTLPVIETYVGTEFARFAWSGILRTVTELGGGPAGWTALRAGGWG